MSPAVAATLQAELWVGRQGLRVFVRQGKVRAIRLCPLGGRKSRLKPPQDRILQQALKQLREYLQGRRRRFSVPYEQHYATPFHAKVYEALQSVPYGQVISYGELARLAGAPGAARAVGSAMKRNQLCVLLPCHRVVAANGIGGYNGQIEWKRALLDLEKDR